MPRNINGSCERVPLVTSVQPNVQEMDDPHFEDAPSYMMLRPRHDPETGVLHTKADFERIYSVANGYPDGHWQELWESAKERNPPLLETKYRVGHGRELDLDAVLLKREPEYFVKANSTAQRNSLLRMLSWCGAPCFAPCAYAAIASAFTVPSGHVQPVMDGDGGYLLAGEGTHCHCAPYWKYENSQCHNYATGVLTHGDWCLAVVDQGFIGLAMDKGQPVLLPPGFHQWKSRTLKFERVIDLNEPVIYLGPYTLLTVDEGYAAVTQNNGRQEIKEGGSVHFLAHRNHKFEKFLSTKIQTDNLARIEVITGDNVLMLTDATVNWKIEDVELAARNAAETMAAQPARGHPPSHLGDISKLRNDVLKQASASLSSFIGTVNYSDSFSPTAQVQHAANQPTVGVPVADGGGNGNGGILFDTSRMQNAVGHANSVTNKYGVEVISINIISARPADAALMNMLAKGAVAAAEAQQLEITAQGKARAVHIGAEAAASAKKVEASAQAACLEIQAKSEADADEERARGAKNAADLLATSTTAVDLAKIDKTGAALKAASASLFFGTDPTQIGALLSNPTLVSK